MARGEDRWKAIVGVVAAHLALGIFLVRGLATGMLPASSPAFERVDLELPPPPPPHIREEKKATSRAAARPAVLAPEGGPTGPATVKTVVPDVTRSSVSTVSAPAGGMGSGTAVGTGTGGGNGEGDGAGEADGGRDSEKIAGEITDRDYPAELGRAGVSGTVSLTLVVDPSGRVGRCTIDRSSGSPELDQLTCRLIQSRFRFRPATDRYGRAIADEIEWDHSWTSQIR